jgi:hypothetical protein
VGGCTQGNDLIQLPLRPSATAPPSESGSVVRISFRLFALASTGLERGRLPPVTLIAPYALVVGYPGTRVIAGASRMPIAWRSSAYAFAETLSRHGIDPHAVRDVNAAWP